MEIILLEKIRHLGNIGDKVSVKPGFGRNYLIPHGKATSATADNIAKFEVRRAELEKAAAEVLAAAKVRAEKLEKLSIVIKAKTSEEGKIFGSIGTREIAKAITDMGAEVAKSEVELPEGVIRQVGEYTITLRLQGDFGVPVKLTVVAEEAAK